MRNESQIKQSFEHIFFNTGVNVFVKVYASVYKNIFVFVSSICEL